MLCSILGSHLVLLHSECIVWGRRAGLLTGGDFIGLEGPEAPGDVLLEDIQQQQQQQQQQRRQQQQTHQERGDPEGGALLPFQPLASAAAASAAGDRPPTALPPPQQQRQQTAQQQRQQTPQQQRQQRQQTPQQQRQQTAQNGAGSSQQRPHHEQLLPLQAQGEVPDRQAPLIGVARDGRATAAAAAAADDDGDDCMEEGEEEDLVQRCRSPAVATADIKCRVCRYPTPEDTMLLCDTCGEGYHYTCIGLDGVPDGDWECHACRRDRQELKQRPRRRQRRPAAAADEQQQLEQCGLQLGAVCAPAGATADGALLQQTLQPAMYQQQLVHMHQHQAAAEQVPLALVQQLQGGAGATAAQGRVVPLRVGMPYGQQVVGPQQLLLMMQQGGLIVSGGGYGGVGVIYQQQLQQQHYQQQRVVVQQPMGVQRQMMGVQQQTITNQQLLSEQQPQLLQLQQGVPMPMWDPRSAAAVPSGAVTLTAGSMGPPALPTQLGSAHAAVQAPAAVHGPSTGDQCQRTTSSSSSDCPYHATLPRKLSAFLSLQHIYDWYCTGLPDAGGLSPRQLEVQYASRWRKGAANCKMWCCIHKVVEEVRLRAGGAVGKAVSDAVAQRILRQLDQERGKGTVAGYVRGTFGKTGKCLQLVTAATCKQHDCAEQTSHASSQYHLAVKLVPVNTKLHVPFSVAVLLGTHASTTSVVLH